MGRRRGRESEGAQSTSAGAPLACISLNTPRKRRASRCSRGGVVEQFLEQQGKENQRPRDSPVEGDDGGQSVKLCESKNLPRASLGSGGDAAAGKAAQGSGGVIGLPGESEKVAAGGSAEMAVALQEPSHWRFDQIAADLAPEMQGGEREMIVEEAQARMVSLLVKEDGARQTLPTEVVLPTLLRAYDKLLARYNRIKARKVDIEAQFEEQRRFNERFQQVADGYIHDLCTENEYLRKAFEESHSQAAQNRMKWLEVLYLKCQKDDTGECKQDVQWLEQCRGAGLAGLITTNPSLMNPSEMPPHEHAVHDENPIRDEDTQVEAATLPPSEQAQRPLPEHARAGSPAASPAGRSAPRDSNESEDRHEAGQLEPESQANPMNPHHVEIASSPRLQSPGINHTMLAMRTTLPAAAVLPVVEISCTEHACSTLANPPVTDSAMDMVVSPRGLKADFDANCPEAAELKEQDSRQVAGLLAKCRLLQMLLGQLMDLSVDSDETPRAQRGPPTLIFRHSLTGLKFKLTLLEDQEAPPAVGQGSALLLYQKVDLGSLVRIAPWWMQEDIVITFDQLGNFIARFHAAAQGCLS